MGSRNISLYLLQDRDRFSLHVSFAHNMLGLHRFFLFCPHAVIVLPAMDDTNVSLT